MIETILNHKGVTGRFEFDETTEVFRGKVSNSNECLLFEGKTVEKTLLDFKEVINAYLLRCEKSGLSPLKEADLSPPNENDGNIHNIK